MENKTQSRKWLLTINNPAEHDFKHDTIINILDKFKAVKYWCMCDEIGFEGTYHTHLFIAGTSGIRFKSVKDKFPVAHIDYCRGTAQENRDYIRKEGKYKGGKKEETNIIETFKENGTMPLDKQGQRNDLINLYDMIKSGMTNYEILETDPECLLHIDKIERCRYIIKQEQHKNEFRNLEVTYIYGLTNTGKSRSVMEEYGYENVFRITDYIHPFDSYKGQDVIIFEEFRSSLKIQDMLNYLDGYPLELPCRYNNKIACFTKVYIISNISLNEQYHEIQKNQYETWKAFLRRIHKVKVFNNDTIKDYTIEQFQHGFIPIINNDVPLLFE